MTVRDRFGTGADKGDMETSGVYRSNRLLQLLYVILGQLDEHGPYVHAAKLGKMAFEPVPAGLRHRIGQSLGQSGTVTPENGQDHCYSHLQPPSFRQAPDAHVRRAWNERRPRGFLPLQLVCDQKGCFRSVWSLRQALFLKAGANASRTEACESRV